MHVQKKEEKKKMVISGWRLQTKLNKLKLSSVIHILIF